MLNTGMTYTDNNTSINLVTCTIQTAEMTMANLTHISFSVIESQTFWSQTGVVEHEIWKFIFFHQKLCFCLIIIKIDLQIITQIVCTYIHFAYLSFFEIDFPFDPISNFFQSRV